MANLLGQMRRGLVINQGPGCIIDFRTEEGASISIIHPGLEFWEQEAPLVPNDPSRITEERLQKILIEKLRTRYRDQEAEIYINYFRLPPACSKEDAENANSQVLGGIRFPNYLKCPNCNTLKHADDWADVGPGKPEKVCPCLSKRENGKVSFVVPSRFLVSCPDGHISDFPWTTYLNYISQYSGPCNHEVFKLTQSSDSGLGGLILSCNDRDCNARGSMQNIFSRDLWNEIDITCSGERPWLGLAGQEECTHKPKTILKGAANGYFPVYESVISIPPVQDSFLERNGIKVHNMREQMTLDQAKDHIRNNALINGFDADEAIKRYEAIDRYASGGFREPLKEEFVRITDTDDEWDEEDSDYDDFIKENMPIPNELSSLIEHLVKIERLREVRALLSFKRLNQPTDSANSGIGRFADLSLTPKPWLPALEVFGEGVFFSLKSEIVEAWEKQEALIQRAGELNTLWKEAWANQTQYRNTTQIIPDAEPIITPRFLLIHSLSHAFINQLALDAGYGVASLKERLYVSDLDNVKMAGILIYTSSSDSEGTLGSLSEKAEPENFKHTLNQAIRNQLMCSNDPICLDGITALTQTFNPAACHSCLILPETSCIHFNRFLDRSTLTGTSYYKGTKDVFKGFFEEILETD